MFDTNAMKDMIDELLLGYEMEWFINKKIKKEKFWWKWVTNIGPCQGTPMICFFISYHIGSNHQLVFIDTNDTKCSNFTFLIEILFGGRAHLIAGKKSTQNIIKHSKKYTIAHSQTTFLKPTYFNLKIHFKIGTSFWQVFLTLLVLWRLMV